MLFIDGFFLLLLPFFSLLAEYYSRIEGKSYKVALLEGVTLTYN